MTVFGNVYEYASDSSVFGNAYRFASVTVTVTVTVGCISAAGVYQAGCATVSVYQGGMSIGQAGCC